MFKTAHLYQSDVSTLVAMNQFGLDIRLIQARCLEHFPKSEESWARPSLTLIDVDPTKNHYWFFLVMMMRTFGMIGSSVMKSIPKPSKTLRTKSLILHMPFHLSSLWATFSIWELWSEFFQAKAAKGKSDSFWLFQLKSFGPFCFPYFGWVSERESELIAAFTIVQVRWRQLSK